MTDIFISYARSTEAEAHRIAEALRSMGYGVWRDDELPAHRAYAEVIAERLKAARAVVVIWSAEAVKSEWVQSEADRARDGHKLVQVRVDDAALPMPFDRIQCADLRGWSGDLDAPGWRKVVASVADLLGTAHGVAPGAAIGEAPLSLSSKPSIAVMPFANLSGDPEQDYFADGMVEEITSALSRARSLFVIGSASGLSLKGGVTTAPEAARALGVRYVLQGSVRKGGGRVRIAVKLIDAEDGAQIWADRFEDTLEDVFALQDKVALSVAGVIEPTVQTAEIERASARPTDNMGSYDLCLRGQSHYRSLTKVDLIAALDLFNRAIALDPDFGTALGFAIACYGNRIVNGWSDDPQKDAQDAQGLIQRAIKVAKDDPEVLLNVALGIMMTGGERATAATFAERALALNPGSSNVWFAIGMVRLQSGEPERAFDGFETALQLNPLTPFRHVYLGMEGMALFAQARFADAIPLLRQCAELAPEWPFPTPFLAASYAHIGDTYAARSALARHRMISVVEARDMSWPEPTAEKFLIDGIAIAEGRAPQGRPPSG